MTKKAIRDRAQHYIALESDPKFRDEVAALLKNEKHTELKERFGTELEFGTGGIRGIIGGGLNCMNPYIVARAAQGIARYLTEIAASEVAALAPSADGKKSSRGKKPPRDKKSPRGKKSPRVIAAASPAASHAASSSRSAANTASPAASHTASSSAASSATSPAASSSRHASPAVPASPRKAIIAYDSRHYSREFAEICAEVFAAHGISAYLFDYPRPTPLLSFAVQKLGAHVGVMITASHNPPEYNGCKVYWEGGAQIVSPHDANITKRIHASETITRIPLAQGEQEGLITYLRDSVDEQYCKYVYGVSLNQDLITQKAASLSVTYTPLHGVGGALFCRLADQLGYTYHLVPEQAEPNGDFPTVRSPNPENPEALDMALKQGKANESDIVIANDPDADRVAIAVWHDDEYHVLSGNQTGALIIDYVLDRHTTLGTLPKNGAVIKTVVTTELQRKVSEGYGIACHDTLTGFKNIAAKIYEFEGDKNGPVFIVGGEESIGYLHGLGVRDKDGIEAAMLILEMALHHKNNGKTLVQRLQEIYFQHGYYEEETISKVLPGIDGSARIKLIMEELRHNPPGIVGDVAVHTILDYQEQKIIDCATQIERPLRGFPVSNIMQFCLADGSRISVRPSGTEPKIKFYTSSCFTPGVDLDQARLITHGMITEARELIEQWIQIKK